MAATIDFANLGTLSPEDYAEQQALSKKQRLAQALLSQGMQKAPQGQMVSGQYVAPSIFEGLNQLAQVAAGKYLEKQGDQEAMDYAQRLRARDAEELKTGLELWRGREGQTANPQAAADFFLTSKSRTGQALGQKLLEQQFKQPNWKETTMKIDGMDVQGQFDTNRGLSSFIPFNASPDVSMADARYKGVPLPTNSQFPRMGMPAQGMPQGMPQGVPQGVPQGAPAGNVPLSVRNNNPGNMVGRDGQFLQFPTTEVGQQAMMNDLNLKLSGQSPAYQARFGNAPVTPLTLAETWSPANAKGNSPESTRNYAMKIAKDLGIDPNSPIPQDPATVGRLQQSMAQFESGLPNTLPKVDKYALPMPETGFQSQKEKDEWLKASREAPTGEMFKKIQGDMGTIRAADKYINTLEGATRAQLLADPTKRAQIVADTKNYMMFQKDAYGLGVLNKEDLPQLEAVVRDPTNIDAILLANKSLAKLARFNQMFLRDGVIQTYQLGQKEMPSFVKNELKRVDSWEENFKSGQQNAAKEDNAPANVSKLRNQGAKVEPKAQDVTQIKAALGSAYDPAKYEYRVVNGKVQARER